MKKMITLLFLSMLFLPLSAFAQEDIILVGTPLGISDTKIAEEVADLLKKTYSVDVQVLSSSCETSSCQIQEAQTKGAAYILTINVANMMGFYGTEINVFDLREGGTKIASAEVEGESIASLKSKISKNVRELATSQFRELQSFEKSPEAESTDEDVIEDPAKQREAPVQRQMHSGKQTIKIAGLLGLGGMYSGVNLELTPPTSGGIADAADLSAIPATVPVGLELRLHYTRFMVNFGLEFAYSANGEWEELLPSPDDKSVPLGCDPEDTCAFSDMETHTVAFNQTNFIGFGYMFGRDVATGFGPRVGLRAGWSTLPNAVTTTGHFGWTAPAPKMERINKRIQLVLDADFRIGATIGRAPSLLLLEDEDGNIPRAALTFGVMGSVGGLL